MFPELRVCSIDTCVLFEGQHRFCQNLKNKIPVKYRIYGNVITVESSEGIRLDDFILEDRLQPPDFHLYKTPESRIVLRKQFPETWLWTNQTAGY